MTSRHTSGEDGSETHCTKLAVIMHADVVASTTLVQRDEQLAHKRIRAAFQALSKVISDHAGEAREIRGDALVAEFERPSDAVTAALLFQDVNADRNQALPDPIRPNFRIGIAMGEVVVADNTVTGSGVILAQRLEQLAAPGGVVISAAIRESVPGRLALTYIDLGEQILKGFDIPQRAHIVRQSMIDNSSSPDNQSAPPLFANNERTSIAVLPFNNLSSDPEQDFFADGMAEDIITALSKFKELLVIARNTTFTFKGGPIDVAAIADELKVRYVLEGSIRKVGDRIRVTAQLIEAGNAGHIWADRYDHQLDDIFELQDEITGAIVGAIAPEVEFAEQVRTRHRPPENLDAWGRYHLGMSCMSGTREELLRAEAHFREAVGLDPSFAAARAWLAMSLFYQATLLPSARRPELLRDAYGYAKEAVRLDNSNAVACLVLGRILGAGGDAEAAELEVRRSVELNPNLWWAHHGLGSVLLFVKDDPEAAIPALQMAAQLNPRAPNRWATDTVLGIAYRVMRQFENAIRFGRLACQGGDQSYISHMNLAATLALAGQEDEAQGALVRAMELEPALSISFVGKNFGVGPKVTPSTIDGLRLAGLQE